MTAQPTKRIVVKVGSSLVTNNGEGLDRAAIEQWAEQVATLLKAGHQLLMVSSGAIAARSKPSPLLVTRLEPTFTTMRFIGCAVMARFSSQF